MSTTQRRTIAVVCLLVILLAGTAVNVRFWKTETKGEDIYYAWVEGGRILNGENPYARVLTGNMQENNKYATYFPLFYELSALTEWAGLRDYVPWIGLWRTIFLAFNLAIAAALFLLIYPRGKLLAAIFAAAFWLFNRWTLHVALIAHLDFVPIFLLIASLGLFRKHRLAALILFSLSLGVKQIGIFLTPLYLVWTWRAAAVKGEPLKETLLAALVIASVPILTALPFLIWNAEGFAKSMLFSVTRIPVDHFGTVSIDALLGWRGLPGKLPMLALLLLITALAWRDKIGRYTGALFGMATFVNYNAVLFPQYLVWVVPFVPLVMCDVWDAVQAKPLLQRSS
jgi:uncharacterized membrane protein